MQSDTAPRRPAGWRSNLSARLRRWAQQVAPDPQATGADDGIAVSCAALAALRLRVDQVIAPWMQGLTPASRSDIQAIDAGIQLLGQRLHERHHQLDAVFAQSPDGLVLFDRDGRVSRVNAAFSRLTGLSAEMLQGVESVVFVFRLNTRCAPTHLLSNLESLRVPAGADPSMRRLHDTIDLLRPQPRTLRLGVFCNAFGGGTQLLQARDVTREAQIDRMKSEFLATAAHELRTPMSSVFGFTELLVTRDMPEARRKDMLERVYRQSGAMVRILNELLDLARIEAGRGMDFEFESTDMLALVQESITDFAVPEGRQAVLLCAPPTALPSARVDRRKLQQALRNLLSNAFKYSPDGGAVEVSVSRDDFAAGGPWVTVCVRDHGIGLSPDELARVGERFYRADMSGAVPGTGLGVSIVQQITELHGGLLKIESQVGQGSRFTVCVPALGSPPTQAEVDALGGAAERPVEGD